MINASNSLFSFGAPSIRTAAFGVGLRMLTLRDLVTEDEAGLFRPRPDHLDVLAYRQRHRAPCSSRRETS